MFKEIVDIFFKCLKKLLKLNFFMFLYKMFCLDFFNRGVSVNYLEIEYG